MKSNHVSAALNDTDAQAILDAIATIRQKLPFLIDLSTEDRRTLPRMGDKTRTFVERALEVASRNQGMLPRSFDIEEFRRDVALIRTMAPVATALGQLNELVDDTLVAVGSDAYVAGLLVYQAAKMSDGGEGLDDLIQELGKRFDHRPGVQTQPTTEPAAA